MDDHIQFLVTLWLTEVMLKKMDATWLCKLYCEPRSIPELHITLINGGSITSVEYCVFSQNLLFSIPFVWFEPMLLMQELISCKHSDISAVINQLKIYLPRGHQLFFFFVQDIEKEGRSIFVETCKQRLFTKKVC